MSEDVSLRDLAADEAVDLEPKTAKGRASRQRLQLAARDVFREQGFANARVSDMAENAGMSLGAFYRYFRDKRDMLMSLLEQLFADMYEFARAAWEPGDPTRSVLVTTRKYLEMYRDNADLYRVLIEAAQTEPAVEQVWDEARRSFYDRIARALRRGQTQGAVLDEIDPELAAVLLGGMTEHYAYLWFVLGRGVNDRGIDAVSEQIAQLWAYGTFAKKGAMVNSDGGSDKRSP